MDSGKEFPPIEGKMSVPVPTGPFFPDSRGNRLEGWTTRAIPGGHELWLRGPAEVARQVVTVDRSYQPCPPSMSVGPYWTHAFMSPQPSMLSQVQSLLELLTQVLTLPVPSNVDFALCLDWYKVPVDGVNPFDWQNSRAGELVNCGKYRYKNHGTLQEQAGRDLTSMLCEAIDRDVLLQLADVVLDVPGHDSTRVSFGPRLAETVASWRGIPMVRVDSTSPFRTEAKNLDTTQRASMLAGQFNVPPTACGKSALIIDDVFQSGSSMAAVATAARASGVVAVQGLCCVRTMRR